MRGELREAMRIARTAGALILENRQRDLGIITKSDGSPSTIADRISSEYLVAELRRIFPNDAVVSEESCGSGPLPGGRCWLVDPLDGTVSYIEGYSQFCVMIGLLEDYKPVLGVAYVPMEDEMVYAERGRGAFIEERGRVHPLHVRETDETDLLITKHRRTPVLEEVIEKLQPERVRPFPGSLKSVEVARGNATLYICLPTVTMNLWDLCTPQVILEEAGGKLTDCYGMPIDYSGKLVNGRGVVSSNGRVHEHALRCIASAMGNAAI